MRYALAYYHMRRAYRLGVKLNVNTVARDDLTDIVKLCGLLRKAGIKSGHKLGNPVGKIVGRITVWNRETKFVVFAAQDKRAGLPAWSNHNHAAIGKKTTHRCIKRLHEQLIGKFTLPKGVWNAE